MKLFLIVSLVLVGDLYTKALIQDNFLLHYSVPVIDGFFNITYVENPGAVFGIMSDMDPLIRSVFFVVVSIVAIVLVLYIYFKHPENSDLVRVASALILGGAVGNMIDRIRFGKVVDFLDIYWGKYHWPAFNVADAAISVGVGLFILDMFLQGKKNKTAPLDQTPPLHANQTGDNKK
jgi:signal peptidase II